ncbi:hypothetical protein QVD17_01649 [Tagetes erecta]|uniref:CCT domain-containing protein n=1 Tax=Tagetes erecta TaxID=13708 RepID=A0AAD8L6R8_TARER|nr:hypothetical protein QVD17_01649 [Tagetes erecta]
MTQIHHNNVLLSSTSFLNYQSAPENTICGFSHASNNPVGNDQEAAAAAAQMAANEIDSWLLPIPCYNQIDGPLMNASHEHGQFDDLVHTKANYNQVNLNEAYGQSSTAELVEQQEHTLNFTQGFQNDYPTSAVQLQSVYESMYVDKAFKIFDDIKPQASLQPTGAGIIPEANFGTMNLRREWALNQFPFHPANLVEETVGIHSNSTTISSQQQNSRDDSKRPSQFPPTSRRERILRYFEKKKSRKYEKKVIHSSRKMYARNRPRVRGRFVRSSQTDA